MDKRFLFVLNLTWAALVVAAFIAGSAVDRGDPEATRSDRTTTSQPDSKPVRPSPRRVAESGPLLTNPDGSIEPTALVRPMTPAEIASSIRTGMTSNDPIGRDLLISQALSQMTAADAPAIAEMLESNDWRSSSKFEWMYERFMLAWGRVDGPSAVAYEQSRTNGWRGFDITESAIRGWSETDPESAVAYLNDAKLEKKKFDTYLTRIVEGVLATDRDRAFSLTANLEPGLRRPAIDAIGEALANDQEGLMAWADDAANDPNADPSYLKSVFLEVGAQTKDGRTTAEWLARNPSYPYSDYDAQNVMYEWAEIDPVAALGWVNSASDSRFKNQLGTVIDAWTRSDFDAAKAWTMNNMENPRIKHAIHHVVDGLAEKDLPAAVAWVEQLDPELVSPGVVSNLVRPWVEQAPADALQWAESVSDRELQKSAIYTAASNWPEDALEDFDAWLSAAGSGADLDFVRYRFAYRIGEQDPARALEIASAITSAKQREDATVTAARKLILQDRETVLRWLPDSGLPEKAQLEILSE